MNYLGGKARLGREIAQVIRTRRKESQSVLEPFCGAAWVTQYLKPATASDISAPLILMHQAVQVGWEPPDFVSEKEYKELHQAWIDGEISPLIGFVGFGVSWGGKWWGGYARGDARIYCLESKNSLLKKHEHLSDVKFVHANYKNLEPCGDLIYVDPPYQNTTGYGTDWDSNLFWNIMRIWSQTNTVIISEYQAPSDFKIIWVHQHFSFKGRDSQPTFERLFEWKN